MHEKKPPSRGVVDSIAALRERRYMTRGPGQLEARKKKPPAPSLAKLRSDVATVAKKAAKKKKRKRPSR